MQPKSEHLIELAKLGVKRQYRAEAIILDEGESGDALYLLLEGEVCCYSQAVSGKVLIYNTIKAGEYFGEMSLDGGLRSASVQALTDCECAVIPNPQVLAFVATYSDFATHLLQTVIYRARLATEAARSMALSDVYDRLRAVLNKEFESNADLCHMTHIQIASQIGASREMVSKLVKDLMRGGYVESLHRRHLHRIRTIPKRW